MNCSEPPPLGFRCVEKGQIDASWAKAQEWLERNLEAQPVLETSMGLLLWALSISTASWERAVEGKFLEQ